MSDEPCNTCGGTYRWTSFDEDNVEMLLGPCPDCVDPEIVESEKLFFFMMDGLFNAAGLCGDGEDSPEYVRGVAELLMDLTDHGWKDHHKEHLIFTLTSGRARMLFPFYQKVGKV